MRSTASIRQKWLAAASQPETGQSDPGSIWRKYSLVKPRVLSFQERDTRYASLSRDIRFRRALEELGGLYVLYGRFLAGRADLLPSAHLSQLLKIRHPQPRPAMRDALEREFGGRIRDFVPLRTASCSEFYRGVYRDLPVVVEIFKERANGFKEAGWSDFCNGIRLLSDDTEQAATRAAVLDEFRQWLAVQADIERKRVILRNLQSIPSGCVSHLPRLVPELQSRCALVYEFLDGKALDSELPRRDASARKSLQIFVESFLEQSLFLSFVATEFDLHNVLLTADQRVAFQTFPAVVSVPAEFNFELLQYTASSVAGDTARAIRMLARILKGESERPLWQELSALQPLLKIRTVTPESISALENYWRAAAATGLNPPLFLQLFHRQATILGRYNGDVAPLLDLISESLWPVIGRIMRFRLSEIASVEKAREWMVGSSLLFIETTRQAGLTLEQLRDNDLSLLVETVDAPSREHRPKQRTVRVAACAATLVIFLVALQIGIQSPSSALRITAGTVAALSGVILFMLISRIN